MKNHTRAAPENAKAAGQGGSRKSAQNSLMLSAYVKKVHRCNLPRFPCYGFLERENMATAKELVEKRDLIAERRELKRDLKRVDGRLDEIRKADPSKK